MKHFPFIFLTAAAIGLHAQSPKPFSETFFGHTVEDPYRYMESMSDPSVQKWMRDQNHLTRVALDALPGRGKILEDLVALDREQAVRPSQLAVCGKALFYAKRLPSDEVEKIYTQDPGRPERLVVDPASLAPAGSHISLTHFDVSADCRYLAVGVASGGAEKYVMHTYSVKDGSEVGPPVDRYGGVSWIPGQDAMFLVRLQDVPKGAPPSERLLKAQVYLHKVGETTDHDRLVFGYGVDPRIPIAPAEHPFVMATPGCRFMVASISHIRGPWTIYVAPLDALSAKVIDWKPVATPDDDVWFALPHGDQLYLVSHKNAPSFRVLKVSAARPDLAAAKVVLAESRSPLLGPGGGGGPIPAVNSIATAKDALYITRFNGAAGEYLRVPYIDGAQPELLTSPRASMPGDVAFDATEDGVYYHIESWSQPTQYVRAQPGSKRLANAGIDPPASQPDLDSIVTDDVMVRAADGTDVPLSITYLRGLKRDGKAPAFLEVYGSYGTSLTPYFNPTYLVWLRRGGIIATAHVRGGGELGEQWHAAGRMQSKPNTWRDLIACAEYLAQKQYTSPARLGLLGASAGGIAVGRALEARPDLFAAVVDVNGVADMLRLEFGPVGPANIDEFGTVKNEDGFEGLLAMSPYHHVEQGKPYPAVLLMTGINDARVPPYHAAKFAARLQAATSSARPVLLSVDYDGGHAGNSARQRQEKQADCFSFLLWQFGMAESR